MNQLITTGIVLARTDFGEADRILTVLTPDHGKLRLLAKGVRRAKSKLAGGIELFSVSDIVYIRGRGELGTLVSTRLIKHYDDIVKDINRTMLAYELLKLLNRNTEDAVEEEYFDLLRSTLLALEAAPVELLRPWFLAQLLRLAGHTPNLQADRAGKRLQAEERYGFSFEDMAFGDGDRYGTDDIKFLRLLFSGTSPAVLGQVGGLSERLSAVEPLVATTAATYLR